MTITKKQAEKEFREIWKEIIKSRPNFRGDIIAKREEWFFFIDNLRTEGRISKHQYNSWATIC